MSDHWMSWRELPWNARSHPQSGLNQFLEDLAVQASTGDGLSSLLDHALSESVLELGAECAAVLERTPAWSAVAVHGRSIPEALPGNVLNEVLDRDAGCRANPEGDPRTLLACPVDSESGQVVVWWGRNLRDDQLPTALVLGRGIGHGMRWVARHEATGRRIERLASILAIARSFAQEKETQPLLERMAEDATRLLDCDRASIFIWDREHKQLIACPALGVEGGKLWLPDNKGIVGEVIQTREVIRVDDAYADSRFDQSVDKSSGYTTRNLLCAPLFDGDGRCIGAFELINKNDGAFTAEDEQGLAEFGVQAAIAIQNSREREQLVRSNRQLTEQVTGGVAIIGESPAIEALRGTIERLAVTDLPVLILGESGTGKEVAAQALHYRGPRADNPFIAVNCAALTETLLESELFGHEKGAFTDAHATHVGKFELAEGGTLFLDEIGDMSLGGQAKLLRVLEQKLITRVGGSQTIPINVRVVAATNSDLAAMVAEKKFRQDLYYRLSVVTVDIPPLRERPEDLVPLAEFFLERFCGQANRRPLSLSAEARRRLQAHAWPGNVRELRNLMERVAFLCPNERVEPGDIAFILSPQRDAFDEIGDDIGLSEATHRFQTEYIKRAIKRVRGNMTDAAKVLGLHRSNLYRKMRHLGMEVTEE